MTREEVITELARERFVETMLKGIARTDRLTPDLQDLCQMVYEALLSYNGVGDHEIVFMWENGRMPFFIARVLMNQYRSNQSQFHKQIRAFTESITDYRGHDRADE